MTEIRLLVCGNREWADAGAIKKRITNQLALASAVGAKLVILHGGAPGADTLAGEAAAELGVECVVFPADWEKHGRSAGPIRNQQMIDNGRPTRAIAFGVIRRKNGHWTGTGDMVARLLNAGIDVLCVSRSTA